MSLPTLESLGLAIAVPGMPRTDPPPGNTIVPTPPSPQQGGPPSLIPTPPKPISLKWLAAVVILWLLLTALYEAGFTQLATGFAFLAAASALFVLGPAAMSQVVNLVSGG